MQQKLPNNKDHYNTSEFLGVHWQRIKKNHSTGVKIETVTQNFLILTGKTNILFNYVTAFKTAKGFTGFTYLSLGKLQTATLPIYCYFLILYIGLLQ